MAKTLAELAALVEGAVINGDKDLTIEDIEHDSRKITQGALFVIFQGFVIIQMILGKIGKDSCVKFNPGYPILV